MAARICGLLCISFLLCPNITWGWLNKIEKNSFVYYSEAAPEGRKISFGWHINPENIASYTEAAIHHQTGELKQDEEIKNEVVYAEVIKFEQSRTGFYDGDIAFIVRTSDDRWFIQFQKPVMFAGAITSKKDFSTYVPKAGDWAVKWDIILSGDTTIGIPQFSGSMYDFEHHMAQLANKHVVEPQTFLFWVTVEIPPNSDRWNMEKNTLNIFDLIARYTTLEARQF